MANAEQELKTLNKTVSDAVNILRLYVGNSSQIKAKNKEEQEIIDKWLTVTDMAEENEKRQRAFTERERDAHGRFIKKQDKQVNKFIGMAESIKGVFSGVANGIKTSITNFASGLKNNFSKVFQEIKGQFLSLFGEESEFFGILSSIKDSIMNFGEGIFRFFFHKTPRWAKKQTKILGQMLALQIKQMKADFLDVTGNKKQQSGWGKALTLILVGIAAGIGAWLNRKLVVLTKLFPIFERLGKAFRLLEELPIIGKVFRSVRKAFGIIRKVFPIAEKSIPFFSKFVKAFKFGFKWLGWPLTIILSTIDFIKGFKETEGSMFEKVKSGLWKAFEGFIDLPIKFIGWVTEKVAGLFGVEISGISDKILNNIHKLFNMSLDGWKMIFDILKNTFTIDNLKKAFKFIINLPSMIFDAVKNAVDFAIESIKNMGNKLIDAITPMISGIHNFFVDFWNGAVKFITSKIPNWLPGKGSIIKGLESTQLGRIEPIIANSPAKTLADHNKMLAENKKQQDEKMTKAINNMGNELKNNNRETTKAMNSIASIQNNRSETGGDVKQIPDETDNYLLGFGVYNGSMD